MSLRTSTWLDVSLVFFAEVMCWLGSGAVFMAGSNLCVPELFLNILTGFLSAEGWSLLLQSVIHPNNYVLIILESADV